MRKCFCKVLSWLPILLTAAFGQNYRQVNLIPDEASAGTSGELRFYTDSANPSSHWAVVAKKATAFGGDTNFFLVQDQAGNSLFRLNSTTIGVANPYMQLAGVFIPDNSTRTLGASVNPWGGIYLTTGFQMTTGASAGKILTTDSSGNGTWQTYTWPGGAVGGDIYPSVSGSYYNGTTSKRWHFTGDYLDIASPSPGAYAASITNGLIYLSPTGGKAGSASFPFDSVGAISYELFESRSNSNSWKIETVLTGTGGANSSVRFKDDLGVIRMLLNSSSLGVANPYMQLAGAFIPDNNSRTLGASVNPWGGLFLTSGFQMTAGASAGRVLTSDGSGNGSWTVPGTAGVSSLSASSPLSATASTGAITLSCSTCFTTSGGTINGDVTIGSGNHLLFGGVNTSNIGSGANPAANIYANQIGDVFHFLPVAWIDTAEIRHVVAITDITAPNGSLGLSVTKTVLNGGGACTLIYSGGVLTGGTC